MVLCRSSSVASPGPAPPLIGGLAVGNARVSPGSSPISLPLAGKEEVVDEGRWSALVHDLLTDILGRVEADAESWPPRRDVVACACVCRRWRDAAIDIVRPPLESGKITFPSSLKQPGPRDAPIECFVKRDKNNSTFYLYLGLTPDKGKFLLAARRFRRGFHMEYIIATGSDGLSRGGHSYFGKLKSNFLGTKFVVYDSQPPYKGAKALSSGSGIISKQISPLISTGNSEVGQVSYEYNLYKSRGPRRIHCSIQCPLNEGTTADPQAALQLSTPRSLILTNRVAHWHEDLHCWCLNFNGRVTAASVKNFQLVASPATGEPWGVQDDKTVILQFGKNNKDVFSIDYRYPLSAFQAFAICLSSFGTKLACK